MPGNMNENRPAEFFKKEVVSKELSMGFFLKCK